MTLHSWQVAGLVIALVGIFIQLTFLTLAVSRIAKAVERGRILDRRAELQDELELIAQAAAAGAATEDDMKRADVIAGELSRTRPTLD
jgi:hypothetical protein